MKKLLPKSSSHLRGKSRRTFQKLSTLKCGVNECDVRVMRYLYLILIFLRSLLTNGF